MQEIKKILEEGNYLSQSLINQGNILTLSLSTYGRREIEVMSQSLINQGNILTKIQSASILSTKNVGRNPL